MSEASLVLCAAVDVCSGVPVTSTLAKQFGGVDPSAALVNAQSQVTVLTRMGEVGTALGRSASKLESLWQSGAAGAGAAQALGQIQGCFGDLVGHGTDLAKQVQAAGKLLQNALRIIEFVKGANKAVAALMSTPWSMPAAKALATATAAQTISWIGIVAQAATAIGQVLTAVQQATHHTDGTTATLGTVLDGGTAAQPAATPPAVSTQSSAYPTYPTVTAPQQATAASPPAATSTAAASGYPTYPTQTGVPTVYQSGGQPGWVARDAAPATTGTGSGSGGLTIDITDADHDGRYEMKVDVPESLLDKDLKIDVVAKVGDQEITGNFDIDV